MRATLALLVKSFGPGLKWNIVGLQIRREVRRVLASAIGLPGSG
jgi:hypothetical protein